MAAFLRNHLWPLLFAAVSAGLTAITTGLPAVLLDGFQTSDLTSLASAAGAAAIGYVATCFNRYGGKDAPWMQPPKA